MNQPERWDYFAVSPFRAFKNAGHYTYRNDWSWESNQSYDCFYYIKKGTMCVQLADEQLCLREGDVVFIGAREKARLSCTQEDTLCYYFVSFYRTEGAELTVERHLRNSGLESLFVDIIHAHRSGTDLRKLLLAQLFLKLIWLCNGNRNTKISQFQAAVEYINMHFDSKITQETLCRICGYSPAHLRRLFIQELGISPQEYLLQKRIDAAKERLLENTDKNMDEIALSLGFCSASHFCKRFKQRVGMTPLTYQKCGSTHQK